MPLLEDLPAQMARSVAALLPSVDKARYIAFVDMMAHYTRKSGDRLRYAAKVAAEPSVRDFFAALADDEQDHYRLAVADLAAFGRRPTDAQPDEVSAFERFWWGLGAGDGLAHLGALYVLERVGGHLQADVRAALGRLQLSKQQARFVLVHLEADADHGARAEALVEAFGRRDEAALTRGAREAADHWVAIHRRALG